jgi:hypothetical protein
MRNHVTLTQPERSQPDLAKRPHGEAEKDRSLLLHEAWSAEMMHAEEEALKHGHSTFRIWGTFDPSEILGESRVAIKCAPVKTPNMQAHAFKVERWSILVISTFIDFIRYLDHAVKPLQLLQDELANTPRNNIENI